MSRAKLAVAITLVIGLVVCSSGRPAAHAQIRINIGRAVSGEANSNSENLFVTDRRLSQQLTKARDLLKKNPPNYPHALLLLQDILDNPEDVFVKTDRQDKTRFPGLINQDAGDLPGDGVNPETVPPKQGVEKAPDRLDVTPKKPSTTRYYSLKSEVQRMIAGLPRAGREAYERRYGPKAKQILAEATELRDENRLQEVSRRFFHTKAGYEATHLLAMYHLDQSRPLAAALNFERLRQFPSVARKWEPMLSLKTAVCWGRAGMPDRAVQTLVDLKKANSQTSVAIAGQRVGFFERHEDALDWLVAVLGQQQQFATLGEEKWLMFRGNPARNAVSSQASPVWESDWQYRTVQLEEELDPKKFPKKLEQLELVDAQLKQMAKGLNNDNLLTLSAAHPLVIDDVVVVRSVGNMKAIDARTGELLWATFAPDATFEKLLATVQPSMTNRVPSQASPMEIFLTQRAWRDMTAGTLSSDGRYVFAIESLGFLGPYISQRGIEHPLAPKDYNRLTAFELDSGLFAWEVGGGRQENELDLAGTFFLGPPLPLRNRLYCLAETSGEIRLLVLEPKPKEGTARLLWSQSLVFPESRLLEYPVRRLAGISPSYADGVMVCSTVAGAVVAVDLGRRELLWGYRYTTNSPKPLQHGRRFFIRPGQGRQTITPDEEDRWLDSAPTLVEGRALLTPRDSNELHCINLADGSLVWKKPRGQNLYLAAVHKGKVILVGRSEVSAYNLADGKPAWKEPTPIATPSGRGFVAQGLYHLPLATGEIATIDLNSGRILAVSKSRTGRVPGNLAAAGGTIVSQTIDSVFGFKSFQSLNAQVKADLKQNPNDAGALALRGEIRLHQGDEQRGVADLRRAFALKPSPRTRELLLWQLLEGLRLDFGKYRQSTAEIEKLADQPQRRATYLRLYAAGLHEAKEYGPAFDAYLKLAGPETGDPQLEQMTGLLSVRSDRWVRPRIADLYRQASATARVEMDRDIGVLLESARKEKQPGQLQKFLNCFKELPAAGPARRLLVERLKRPIEIEFQLQHLRRSKDSAIAGFATARLASLLLNHNRPDRAVDLFEELTTKWAAVVCLDKKTGNQLVEEWRKDEKVKSVLANRAPWPDANVKAESNKNQTPAPRSYAVQLVGPRSPAFENWNLHLDARRQKLVARDGNGDERWKVALNASPQQLLRSVSSLYSRSSLYARAHGHLLVVVLGYNFLVLDTLAAGGSPKILWQRQLSPTGSRGLQFGPFAGRNRALVDSSRRPIGKVGPVSDDYLCYQNGTRLLAVDPLTGRTLWERRNVARGSEISGDAQHVLLVAPGNQQATVLRASDGELVVERVLPTGATKLKTNGRNILVQDESGGKGRLTCMDALTGNTIWQWEFSADAKTAFVKDDEVAIFEPVGHFTILAIDSGNVLVESPVEADPKVAQIAVHRSRDQYTLLTYRPDPNQRNMFAVGIDNSSLPVNGFTYGFLRQTGRKLWTTEIHKQALPSGQSANLPILIFMNRHRQLGGGFGRTSGYQYAVAILDKRNGKLVYQDSGERPLFAFETKAHREQQTIDVNFYHTGITLAFSNQPSKARSGVFPNRD